MNRLNKIMICVLIGFMVGSIVQCVYDIKQLNKHNDELMEQLEKDTVYVNDTIPSDTLWFTKYKPTPSKTYTTHDTVYIQNMPIVALKNHKVYNSSIDTIKALGDTLKYAQTIKYHITTIDNDIDTIQIATQEDIPVITHYVEKTKTITKKPKLILSAGVGVGLNTKGNITPNIGITLGYPIWILK